MVHVRRRVAHALAIVVAAAAVLPQPAHAQHVLISSGGVTGLYDVDAGRVEWTLPFPIGFAGVVFTSDGRYAVTPSFASTTPAIRLIDVLRGSSVDVPLSFEPRVAHPRATAMFGLTGGPLSFGAMTRGTLARLDPGGLTLYGGCPPKTTVTVDLSGDGQLLFAQCEAGDLVVLDAQSGAVLRTLPLQPRTAFAASYDGATVIVARPVADGTVDALDSTTGALQASTSVPAGFPCTPSLAAVSPDRTTFVVNCTALFGAPVPTWTSQVLNAPALTWGVTLAGAELRVASISPDNATAFSSYAHRTGTFGRVQVHDLASGAMTLSAPIVASIAVSFAPLEPIAAAAMVAGRRVDLSWDLPPASPAATGYVLEIGSAPGLTNLGTVPVGPTLTLTVPAAPPGRYFVRVRAENAAGRSEASNEVEIEVP